MRLCSRRCGILLFIISAIPVAFIISLERAMPSSSSSKVYYYHSSGFFRECGKWDDAHRRFLVSRVEGGLAQIRLPSGLDDDDDGVLEEETVVNDVELVRNSSLGFVIDSPRNRVVVVYTDLIGNKYSALAAYHLSSWERLFLTTLTLSPGDAKIFADDVAVDAEGNAYVTDTISSKIWKVGIDGEIKSIITSPLFTQKEWYKNLVGLNGIVYHPDGYLLVIHTLSGNLYKVHIAKKDDEEEKVKRIDVIGGGSLFLGDGLELISPTKLVVAGNPSGRLVESLDGWETASVVGKFKGPAHRLATGATVKDGKVYLNHMVGVGYPRKKHALVEAVFSSY